MSQTEELKYFKLTYENRDYNPNSSYPKFMEQYNTKYFKVSGTNSREYLLREVLQDFSHLECLDKTTYDTMVRVGNEKEYYMSKFDWNSNDFHCYDYTKYYTIEETQEDLVLLHGID